MTKPTFGRYPRQTDDLPYAQKLLSLGLAGAGFAAPTDPMAEMETIMLAQRTRPDIAQFERARRFAEAVVIKTPKDAG